MISVEYCQLLARYNRWMNERMYAAAAAMSDDERKRERGAFFGSLHRTLNHILWGDRVWLGRFTNEPCTAPAFGADMFDDFAQLARERDATDTRILDWAGKLSPQWLADTLVYTRSADGGRLDWAGKLSPQWLADTLVYTRSADGGRRELPAWIAATHLFQHAAHHRGQATTLLKQAGHDMGVTDLQYLPGIVRVVD